jgi:hypothetical protein
MLQVNNVAEYQNSVTQFFTFLSQILIFWATLGSNISRLFGSVGMVASGNLALPRVLSDWGSTRML